MTTKMRLTRNPAKPLNYKKTATVISYAGRSPRMNHIHCAMKPKYPKPLNKTISIIVSCLK